jgi:hypothetical protein
MGETAFSSSFSLFFFIPFTFQIFQSLKVILSTVNTGSRAPNACYRAPALRNYDFHFRKKFFSWKYQCKLSDGYKLKMW